MRPIRRTRAITGSDGVCANATPIVDSTLRRHSSALERSESSTGAAGLAAASSRQNALAGQSTAATYPSSRTSQSGGVPSAAACQTSTAPGVSDTSRMW